MQKLFVNGPISPELISREIEKHQEKTGIGAHTFFAGQVRADKVNDKEVKAIDFTAYESMAIKEVGKLREEILAGSPLKCLPIYHSLGEVRIGEVCFFVFLSGAHRRGCFEALEQTVDLFKERVPIWKQLCLEDGSRIWKENEPVSEHDKEH